MEKIIIREMKPEEYPQLAEFTFQAIFLPDDAIVLPREVLQQADLRVYYEDFGKPDDNCLVAEVEGRLIGAAWARILSGKVKGFGYLNEETPEFGISLFKEYRNMGVGTALMEGMLELLRKKGYQQASLAVQKENYALKMYQKVGFKILLERGEEYIMLCPLG